VSRQREDITRLLNTVPDDEPGAADLLWEAVYPELRARAGRIFSHERQDHTLSATGVLNEAYLRLAHLGPREWKDRTHFYATASGIMRQVLVDHARTRLAAKRGGGAPTVPLEEEMFPAVGADLEGIRAAEEALEWLALRHERAALVVALRVFGGLTVDEVAEEVGVSARTVKADWLVARGRLRPLLQH
jgi:RNA polymerase sigma factor (TIGR02999 family)